MIEPRPQVTRPTHEAINEAIANPLVPVAAGGAEYCGGGYRVCSEYDGSEYDGSER